MLISVIPFKVSGDERMSQRTDNATQVATRGVPDFIPNPPRNLMAQSGARKVILTWDGAVNDVGIVGYRCFYPDEVTLFQQVSDPQCRRMEVSVNSGASPQKHNFFVCSITAQKVQSPFAWVQGSAKAEAAAPADPAPPPGYPNNPSGGSGGSSSFTGSGTGSGHRPSSPSPL